MKVRVEFIWWSSHKIWEVYGHSMDEIIEKCWKMADKYHAQHFQILD